MVKVVYVYDVITIRVQTSIPPWCKWIRSTYGVYYMVCGVGLWEELCLAVGVYQF